MFSVFLFCAIVGGAIMAFQLAMTLMGLSTDGMDADASDALDAGGDVMPDFGDIDDVDIDGADAQLDDLDDHADSTHGFKVLSFRTLVAAVTFFGLGGLIAVLSGAGSAWSAIIAILAGWLAMWGVYKLYATLYGLSHDGTARVDNAVGCYGNVYIRIPENESGQGKVLLNVQGRTMEYQAVTPGEMLKSGTKIVVTRVITANTVEVEPAIETCP